MRTSCWTFVVLVAAQMLYIHLVLYSFLYYLLWWINHKRKYEIIINKLLVWWALCCDLSIHSTCLFLSWSERFFYDYLLFLLFTGSCGKYGLGRASLCFTDVEHAFLITGCSHLALSFFNYRSAMLPLMWLLHELVRGVFHGPNSS